MLHSESKRASVPAELETAREMLIANGDDCFSQYQDDPSLGHGRGTSALRDTSSVFAHARPQRRESDPYLSLLSPGLIGFAVIASVVDACCFECRLDCRRKENSLHRCLQASAARSPSLSVSWSCSSFPASSSASMSVSSFTSLGWSSHRYEPRSRLQPWHAAGSSQDRLFFVKTLGNQALQTILRSQKISSLDVGRHQRSRKEASQVASSRSARAGGSFSLHNRHASLSTQVHHHLRASRTSCTSSVPFMVSVRNIFVLSQLEP